MTTPTPPRPQKPFPPGEWIKCPICPTMHDGGRHGTRQACANRKCSAAITAQMVKGMHKPKALHQKKAGHKEKFYGVGRSTPHGNQHNGGRKPWVNV